VQQLTYVLSLQSSYISRVHIDVHARVRRHRLHIYLEAVKPWIHLPNMSILYRYKLGREINIAVRE
jgi:hypothetical protein